jgi:hypothetical protein
LKGLVLEDLIRNVHTLFDERPSSSPTVPSPQVAETTGLPQPSQVDAMGSTTRHRPGLVGVIPTSTPSSLSSLPLDVALQSRLTPSLTTLLGLPSPKTLVEGVETASQEQARDSEAAVTLVDSASPEVVAISPTSVTEWRLRLSQLPPETVTIPQSPPESVFSSTTDFPLSSIMSL